MAPTSPIELSGTGTRFANTPAPLPTGFVDRLTAVTEVVTDVEAVADVSRDWWPLALHWALAGQVPQRAALVARPADTNQVAQVLALCEEAGVPVTPAGGRSGVCGASVPVFGGVLLDMTRLDQVRSVDEISGVVEVDAGVFGPDLESRLREGHGLTVGHFPQSFEIATVGGLEIVRADGRVIRTGGAPAAATGPDLTQLFAGSEGTLGVITRVWLRARPVPLHTAMRAFRFTTVHDGFEACRRIVRRAPRRPCCVSTTRPNRLAAAGAMARRAHCWCSTRATPRSSTPRSRSWTASAGRSLSRPSHASSRSGSSTATTRRPCRP